ncbi:DnaJ -like protein subfamily C member 22 [Sarcoptes scabiei]|uniref:DnaJ -like protein subfamily C member 22 n=1 Tax=Sarcoptes scabiei TaxID=52283 RepID=A0A132A6X7_SARSC|nr:DnaJ -like protein subfamily C member 22 [Sarcoptes scabiei]KPM06718.1 dnaJ domain containing protein 1 [Sarcoptes scabiei]
MGNQKQKSLFVAYLWLIIGGFFGLHQIYLHRFRHAFAIMISMGGYFGCGVFRDLWRLPEYVSEANDDVEYRAHLIEKMRKDPRPSFGYVRFAASVTLADILGYLIIMAIPHELFVNADNPSENLVSRILICLFVPLACTVGVHIVGNVGRYTGSIQTPLIAAYCTAPLYWFGVESVFITSFIATIVFSRHSLRWRRTPLTKCDPKNFLPSILLLIVCFSIYSSFWISWFYFNCKVTDKNDETIKCREALRNLFNSPAWLEFRSVCQNLWQFVRTHGISGVWNEIVDALDPQGEHNALRTLELDESATQEAITANYRKLAKIWHPDKHKDIEAKRNAQEKFMAIQQAYELLSNIKQKRIQKQMD